MVSKYLDQIFDIADISQNFILINCTLGYNGDVNILCADGTYGEFNTRYQFPFKVALSNQQNYRIIILGKNFKIVELNREKVNYQHGFQVDIDKYCYICRKINGRFKNNLIITDGFGKKINKISIGNMVNDVQTNSNQELWVSYLEEGVYFASFDSIEKNGLNCFDLFGNISYTYEFKPKIAVYYSFNVISENEILINTYSYVGERLALGKIFDKRVDKVIEWKHYTDFLAYYNNMILVENKSIGEKNQKFALLDINNNLKIIKTFEFFGKKKERLNCICGQGDKLLFFGKSKIYSISIKELL